MCVFQDFLQNQRRHPEVGGLKLTDLLIMPVQVSSEHTHLDSACSRSSLFIPRVVCVFSAFLCMSSC